MNFRRICLLITVLSLSLVLSSCGKGEYGEYGYHIKEDLEKHRVQAEKYFNNSDAKIICLTNGLKYDFYSDSDKDNKMDSEPFFSLDIEHITEFEISYLIKLSNLNFNLKNYEDVTYQIKSTEFIRRQLENPNEEFIRFIADNISKRKKTKKFLSKVREFIYHSIRDVLSFFSNGAITVVTPTYTRPKNESNIVTTQEELDGYKIIISILSEIYSIDNVTHKDTQSYFAIIADNKPKQWIVRLCLGTKKKSIMVPNNNGKYDRFYINDIQDLYDYKEQILDSASKYLAIKVTVTEPVEYTLLNEPEIIEVSKKKKTILERIFH